MASEDYKFQKLTPVHNADLNIYKDALDFVFQNSDVKNVGISGAYSAGKSSVIETYKECCPQKKFLYISLAYFEPADSLTHPAQKASAQKTSDQNTPAMPFEDIVDENVLEGKILNQLIHQIDAKKIPQTNFRIKRYVSKLQSFVAAFGILLFSVASFYIINFANWKKYVDTLSSNWLKTVLQWSTNSGFLLLSYAIISVLLFWLLYTIIMLQKNKSLFKKVSVQGNEIEIFEQSDDSYFDKYLNEVIYLFENSEADAVVFEDMDRYNANQIFQRLREVNTLINNRRKKQGKTSIRFFYLLRDDIFISKDRTKFFDFILPIVPILDGSNSYDQFIAHFKAGGLFQLFNENFLQGISLYVDDMRILKNIYNEFVVYNTRIGTTEQDANKLLAMIVYKNLFPRDFSDLQLGKGFVFTLFFKKDIIIEAERCRLKEQIELFNDKIEKINNEMLKLEIESMEQKIQILQNQKLSEIINRENIESIFQSNCTNKIDKTNEFTEIKNSDYFDLLKYLVRNGFIDETYPDYMTYFYENSLSRIDKVFLRSVTDERAKEYTYSLQKPNMIISRLRLVDFDNKETLNFDLFCFLLQNQSSYLEQLKRLVLQLKNSDNFDFIIQFISYGQEIPEFIKFINHHWPQLFEEIIQKSKYSETQKKLFALLSLYFSPDEDLITINIENVLSNFVSQCPDFLQIDEPKTAALLKAFEVLNIRFKFIDYSITNTILWGEVYSHNLYELNWEMIETILENQYKIPRNNNYIHKNLTLILSNPKELLASYTKKNMNAYFELMFNHCKGQVSDNEDVVIFVLNDINIEDKHKYTYIDSLSTQLTTLSDVSNTMWWPELIKNELLIYSEANVLCYFFGVDKTFDDTLIQFINKFVNSFLFKYDDIEKEFGEHSGAEFFEATVKCNGLQNAEYKSILQSLNKYYPSFAFQDINMDKIEILIDLRVIGMNSDTLLFMRENYPEKIISFILKNIEQYVDDTIDENNFFMEEALKVLQSNVDSVYKFKLLKHTNESISVQKFKYEASIESYILEHNFDLDDLPYLSQDYDDLNVTSQVIIESLAKTHIDDICTNEYSISYTLLLKLLADKSLDHLKRLELFAFSLLDLNQAQCKSCLEVMESQNYLSLFDGKRPKFEINNVNECILKAFQKNRWITKYELDESSAFYRAIGRKLHPKQKIPSKLLKKSRR